MPILALAPAAMSLYSGIKGASDAKKAASQAKDAAAASQVDIDALDKKTREIARRNAMESMQLEQELTPEVAALRKGANEAVLANMGNNEWDNYVNDKLYGASEAQFGANKVGPAGSGLLTDAIARARGDLALGGKLDQDTQNAVMRAGLQQGGTGTGGAGLGLGRDIAARDLGLRSMDVANQRLGRAASIGQQELGMNQGNQANEQRNNAFGLDVFNSNRGGLMQALQQMSVNRGQNFSRALAGAQYGESIARPVVGLDPTAIANLTTGNQNAQQAGMANQANVSGAQSKNYFGLAGQIAGGIAGSPGGWGAVGQAAGNIFKSPVATPPYVPQNMNTQPFGVFGRGTG